LIQLAHERDVIVLPIAVAVFLICAVYCAAELNRRYVRWRNASAVLRVAIVAPWLQAGAIEDVVAAAGEALESAGHTVLLVPSAFDTVMGRMQPRCHDTGLLPSNSTKDAIRHDAPISTAAAVLRMAVAAEDEARILAAGAVRSRRFANGSKTVPEDDAETGLTIELCAGGALDAEALCETKMAWSRVWHRTGWRKPRLLKRYDAVVLITARADGDRQAAEERAPEAARVAARRAALWMAHPVALTAADASPTAVNHEALSAVIDVARRRLSRKNVDERKRSHAD